MKLFVLVAVIVSVFTLGIWATVGLILLLGFLLALLDS